MGSKETVEDRTSTELPEPLAPPEPADAARDHGGVPSASGGLRALPARFLEGTAWDEV
jgi:hypothetical protein